MLNDNLSILLGDGNDCAMTSVGQSPALNRADICLLLQEDVCVDMLCKSSFFREKSNGGFLLPTI